MLKKAKRNGKRRYVCRSCKKWFSLERREKPPSLWIPYIDGLPIRKLADQEGYSIGKTYTCIRNEFEGLPSNTDISKNLCDPSKWCGVLCLDGKYLKVVEERHAKEKSIPFIYGIDFLSHDIPCGAIALSENMEAFLTIFKTLKEIGYPLKVVVCDGNTAIEPALKRVFPEAVTQLCHTHVFKNIADALHLKTDNTHLHFFNSLKKHIFRLPQNHEERVIGFAHVFHVHAKGNLLLEAILEEIADHEEALFRYKDLPNVPNTNNLIEGTNTQVKARVIPMRALKTRRGADLFVNAWMLRRRTKTFTDCGKNFRHLNGTRSLDLVLKEDAVLPEILKK